MSPVKRLSILNFVLQINFLTGICLVYTTVSVQCTLPYRLQLLCTAVELNCHYLAAGIMFVSTLPRAECLAASYV